MVILQRSWPHMLSCWRTYVHRFLNGETIFVPPLLQERETTQLNEEQTDALQIIVDQDRALQIAEQGSSAV